MNQQTILTVPTDWPLMWASGDDVRMACPECGTFHAYLARPTGGTPTLACRECGLNGLAAFQRKFNALTRAKPARPTLTAEEIPA